MSGEPDNSNDGDGTVESLRQRIRELEDKMLYEKLAAVSRLAGGVSHDLNNMLTPILAYGSMVMEDLPPDSPLQAYMKEMVTAGERSLAMTKILQRLRLKASGMVPLAINDTLLGQIEKMRPELPPSVRLDVNVDPAADCVMVEFGTIEKVADELIRNACEAMPSGGRLAVTTRLAEGPAGKRVVLAVKDEGVGLKPEARDHLGEPYYTTKPKGQGKGLGLAVVYALVIRAGGSIQWTSEVGAGTEFNVSFRSA